jgi:hypothetical protein
VVGNVNRAGEEEGEEAAAKERMDKWSHSFNRLLRRSCVC